MKNSILKKVHFIKKECLLKKFPNKKKVSFKNNCLKVVTIQYLPVDCGPYGAEILNRHLLSDKSFVKYTFLKRHF